MRLLFEEKKKLVLKTKIAGESLDRLINNKWGFHYSETDDDKIIDTLDYGTTSLTFKDFVERMDEYKLSVEKCGSFR